ncbi:MAG: peptide deformylase [Turicibacter sp.]|nr:peptide deformylase [Turicibacter sp.]
MALRKIRQYGDSILRKKAKPVQYFDGVLHNLLDDMWETLRHNEGLGMAATQVGILKQVIVIELEDETFELINPKIVRTEGLELKTEACLSVPNKQGDVERPVFISVKAYNRYGEEYVIETEDDMLTTAICHEMDHLEGILFIDKAQRVQDRPMEENVKKPHTTKPKKNKNRPIKTKIITAATLATA